MKTIPPGEALYLECYRLGTEAIIEINSRDDSCPLPMSEYATQCSPTGYNWGYGGSGPFASAHSIMTWWHGGIGVPPQIAHTFMRSFIAPMVTAGGTITRDAIERFCREYNAAVLKRAPV